MSLNCTEIDKILEELDLEGSYIQKIVQSSYSVMVLHLYKNRPVNLLICLEPGACRLHETRQKIPKFDKPLRFMELLRSRLRGAKITKAEQLNHDRIVKLSLEAASRHEMSGESWREPEAAQPDTAAQPAKVYTIRSYDPALSFNEAIDQWYAQKAPVLSLEALRAEAEQYYGLKIEKLTRALEKLTAKKQSFLESGTLKHQGDILLANLYRIPPGASVIELEDYAEDNRIIRINLDPRKTAQENAAVYYERYKKAVSGLEALTDDIEASKRAIESLIAEREQLRHEENPHIIDKILRKKKIPAQQKHAAQEKERPGLTFYYQDWILYVGRTAAENDELLRHHVRGKDMWLHARDYAGGYVFIKNKNEKTVPLPVLIAAGNLAVFYSKARKNGQADLYYTAVKNLRRAKNAPKGTVLPSNEKNLLIKLDSTILKQLEASQEAAETHF